MKKKRQHSGRKKDPVADSLRSSEQDDLDVFCSAVQIEEICFEEWQEQHSKLDLCYPLIIRRSQIHESFRTVIRMTRTIKDIDAQGNRVETREKFEQSLELPAEGLKPRSIRLKGLGDRCGERVGDLLIVLEIRD